MRSRRNIWRSSGGWWACAAEPVGGADARPTACWRKGRLRASVGLDLPGGPAVLLIIRPLLIALVVLTAIYLVASAVAGWMERLRLGREFDREIGSGDRDAYIAEGMAAWRRSIRRRVLLLIYLVPLGFFAVVFYVVNYM